jgi:AraC-like DNA-binding protein
MSMLHTPSATAKTNVHVVPPRHRRILTNDVNDLQAAFRGGVMQYIQHRCGNKPTQIHDLQTPLVNLRHARFGQAMTTISDDGVERIGFVVSLKGELNGCGQPTTAGNVVHYDIDQGVQLKVSADSVFVSGSVDRDLAQQLSEQHGYPELKGNRRPETSPTARAILIDTIRDLTLKRAYSGISDRQIQHQACLALLRCTSVLPDRQLPRTRQRRVIVRRAIEYIEMNYQRDLTITELCCAAQTTERTLRYAFVDLVGIAPQRYLIQKRLQIAYKLLKQAEPGVTVAEVAIACGFRHGGRFACYFGEMFGERPYSVLVD